MTPASRSLSCLLLGPKACVDLEIVRGEKEEDDQGPTTLALPCISSKSPRTGAVNNDLLDLFEGRN